MTKEEATKTKEEKELVTATEAAKVLEVGRRTMEAMRKKAGFPKPIRWGKRDMYVRASLLAWKAAQLAALNRINEQRLAQVTGGAA